MNNPNPAPGSTVSSPIGVTRRGKLTEWQSCRAAGRARNRRGHGSSPPGYRAGLRDLGSLALSFPGPRALSFPGPRALFNGRCWLRARRARGAADSQSSESEAVTRPRPPRGFIISGSEVACTVPGSGPGLPTVNGSESVPGQPGGRCNSAGTVTIL
eukprot:460423-Hanusia_phi.AAC.1